MTWTKLPDTFYDDPTLLALSRDARLLHVEALTWCNRFGTDGNVPRAALGRITDSTDAAASVSALTEAGCWSAAGDSWLIEGFLDTQPSAEDVARVRALAQQRQHRARQHKQGDHSLCNPDYCHAAAREQEPTRDATRDSRRDKTGARDTTRDQRSPDPSRPDPTRKGRGGREGQADSSRSLPGGRSAPRPHEENRGTVHVGQVTLPTARPPRPR